MPKFARRKDQSLQCGYRVTVPVAFLLIVTAWTRGGQAAPTLDTNQHTTREHQAGFVPGSLGGKMSEAEEKLARLQDKKNHLTITVHPNLRFGESLSKLLQFETTSSLSVNLSSTAQPITDADVRNSADVISSAVKATAASSLFLKATIWEGQKKGEEKKRLQAGGEEASRQSSKVAVSRAAAFDPAKFMCSGVCCSSYRNPTHRRVTQSTTKVFPSRWYTNALYHKAQLHLLSIRGQYWSPRNNPTGGGDWRGTMGAYGSQKFRGQAYGPTVYVTVIRASPNKIQFALPGGGYLRALPPDKSGTGFFDVTSVASQSGTYFGFVRFGNAQAAFSTYLGTFITCPPDGSFQHYAFKANDWEKFYIYEVQTIPAFRGVNLGSWLVPEQWMTPDVYSDFPIVTDGSVVVLQSFLTKQNLTSSNGRVYCNSRYVTSSRDNTFVIRMSQPLNAGTVWLRVHSNGQWVTVSGSGLVTQTVAALTSAQSLKVTIHPQFQYLVMIRDVNKRYLTSTPDGSLFFSSASSVSPWSPPITFRVLQLSQNYNLQTLSFALGQQLATQRIQRHYASFITEADFVWLWKRNINAVRIPIPHWIHLTANPPYPLPIGAAPYLDWAFRMAAKYSMQILVDLHTSTASLTAGTTPDGFFDAYAWTNGGQATMLQAVEWISQRYGNHPSFFGIGSVNEPTSQMPAANLAAYYALSLQVVRKHTQCAFLAMDVRIGGSPYEYFQFPSWPNLGSNLVVDYHLYYAYTPGDIASVPAIQKLTSIDQGKLQVLGNTTGYLSMVGEWSLSFNIGGIADQLYHTLGGAELQTFSTADVGHFFWSYKLQTDMPSWDFNQSYTRGLLTNSLRQALWP